MTKSLDELADENWNKYDKSIHSNPDAKAWAEFFKKVFTDSDEGLMHSWFANAMMAMHDHLHNTKIGPLTAEIQSLKECLAVAEEALNNADRRMRHIHEKTIHDPAGEAELRARAAYVFRLVDVGYKESTTALEKIAALKQAAGKVGHGE